jgi:hypothetical protein
MVLPGNYKTPLVGNQESAVSFKNFRISSFMDSQRYKISAGYGINVLDLDPDLRNRSRPGEEMRKFYEKKGT